MRRPQLPRRSRLLTERHAVEAATALNGRHRGETIFVVGAGPQLAHLSHDEVSRLEERTTIGVNMTFYRVRPTYFLSAYLAQVLLARHRVPRSVILHMRLSFERALAPGVLPVKRSLFDRDVGLPDRFSGPEPTIITLRNVALGATHLAHILGAKRIAYIGVEQRNKLHFWHFDESVRATVQGDLGILRDVPNLSIDHAYSTYESLVEKIGRSREDMAAEPFYEESHAATFREYFACLGAAGVEVVTTVEDSVVADAGAPYIPLAELLDDSPAVRGRGRWRRRPTGSTSPRDRR